MSVVENTLLADASGDAPARELRRGFAALGVDAAAIEKALGYPPGGAPEAIAETVARLLTEAYDHVEPRAGFRIFGPGRVTIAKAEFAVGDAVFGCGPIIGAGLRRAQGIVFFTATAGPALDAWSRSRFDAGDMLEGYVIDTIGSETVERMADWLEDGLRASVQAQGFGLTNRYSPGYCGWAVREQHRFFSLLPADFCGIRLTESALMQPIKSVSGVMGLGPEAEKENYNCRHCPAEFCLRRDRLRAVGAL